ncbi:MAG TPA: VOC family protein [Candidatus Methylomirabilis sp.]|nr:VOC family protein [Candidatus Methylomirabilis sp.]
MPKIKHIALSTQDVEVTARFYIEVFGMKEVGKIDDPGTRGCFLTDGDINLAILNFKNDTAAGVERGKGFCGIHHFGFQVESHDAIAERLHQAGARRREDVEQALGVAIPSRDGGPRSGGRQPHGNVEVKYTGPDGVMLDVSETGWLGTPTFGA